MALLRETGTFSICQLEKTRFNRNINLSHIKAQRLSIPIKDTNGNGITLRRVGTAYDSVYKENGKWYLRKSINEQVLNGSEGWIDESGWIYLPIADAKLPVNDGTLPNLITTTHQTRTYNQISLAQTVFI